MPSVSTQMVTPRLPGFFACAVRAVAREPVRSFGLMHDDIAPLLGVRRQAERMQVDHHETPEPAAPGERKKINPSHVRRARKTSPRS